MTSRPRPVVSRAVHEAAVASQNSILLEIGKAKNSRRIGVVQQTKESQEREQEDFDYGVDHGGADEEATPPVDQVGKRIKTPQGKSSSDPHHNGEAEASSEEDNPHLNVTLLVKQVMAAMPNYDAEENNNLDPDGGYFSEGRVVPFLDRLEEALRLHRQSALAPCHESVPQGDFGGANVEDEDYQSQEENWDFNQKRLDNNRNLQYFLSSYETCKARNKFPNDATEPFVVDVDCAAHNVETLTTHISMEFARAQARYGIPNTAMLDVLSIFEKYAPGLVRLPIERVQNSATKFKLSLKSYLGEDARKYKVHVCEGQCRAYINQHAESIACHCGLARFKPCTHYTHRQNNDVEQNNSEEQVRKMCNPCFTWAFNHYEATMSILLLSSRDTVI